MGSEAEVINKIKGEIIQQNSTLLPVVFKPTKKMIEWLIVCEKLGHTASISDIAKKSGIDRSNWYKWMENPQFVEFWDQAWKRIIKLQRHKLDLIGLKKAEEDHDWWRDMKKVVGEPIPEDGQQATQPIQVNNQINLANKYMEEVPDAKNKL